MSGESPEELAAWGAELGEKGDQAATALQSRMRAKQAKKEVDALRQQLAAVLVMYRMKNYVTIIFL